LCVKAFSFYFSYLIFLRFIPIIKTERNQS
jgi:hypothetical protein